MASEPQNGNNNPAAGGGGGGRENSAAAALFQRAHQKMLTLSRIDEQLNTLIDQRKKVQDELKTVQALINEEFDRYTKLMGDMPHSTVTTSISDEIKSHGRGPRIQQHSAEEAAA